MEAKYGSSVVENSRRAEKVSPSQIRVDEKLVKIVGDFCESTGWSVAWTRDPYLLAKAQPAESRVVLSLGWITESNDDKDRCRLPYLTDTLRRLRHAIEDADLILDNNA